MVRNGKDAAPVALNRDAAMAEYGEGDFGDDSKPVCVVKEIPAIKILNERADYPPAVGVFSPWIRPILKRLPWYSKGKEAGNDLAGMAIAAVAKRLAFPTDRPDILSKLQQGKDEQGRPMGREELTSEAFGQIVAGSDTVSK